LNYRADVDGLRALAVAPVVLFHAQIPGFSGGFVGVDLFFVISGFLITSILVAELQAGDFSLVRFYERRARRILPALLAMLLVCVLAGYFFLRPDQYLSLGKSVLATLVFSSNVWFWQSTDYFSEPAELNPLLHTWSLAVEEQYYLAFPLLLIALVRWRQSLFPYFVSIALLSFLTAELLAARSPSGAFYLAPSRAWELMVGSLLSLTSVKQTVKLLPEWGASALATFALLLIVGSIVLLDEKTPFPGLFALPVVVGGGLLIYTGAEKTWVARMLSTRGMVFVGLISYSLYLWHQPVLVFSRIADPARALPVWLWVLLAVVFGWLSWRYVERPFRDKSRFNGRRIFRLSGVWTLVTGSAALLLWLGAGLPYRIESHPYSQIVGYNRQLDRVSSWDYAAQPGAIDLSGKVAFVGDSHAKDLYNALVAGGCLATEDAVLLTSNKLCEEGFFTRDACASAFAYPGVDLNQARGVVFAPFWNDQQLQAVGSNLQSLSDNQVPALLYAPTPAFVDVPMFVQNRLWIKPQRLEEVQSQLQQSLVVEHVACVPSRPVRVFFRSKPAVAK